jgi:hypothetical protein
MMNGPIKSIIVGNISERGVEWWRNLRFTSQNARHSVPVDYTIHGNFNPVYRATSTIKIMRRSVIILAPAARAPSRGAGSVVLQN